MIIHLAGTLDDAAVELLLEQLQTYRLEPTLDFDFSQLGFVYPHATLVAAAAIADLRDYRRECGLATRYLEVGVTEGTRSVAAGYLAHIGFFRFLGIPHGKAPGEAPGGSTYVPIMRLAREDLTGADGDASLYGAIERESYRLASLACSGESATELLAYCFRETIRNVFEHAMTDRCVLMAQKYMGTQVHIAVVDFGRGIHASLSDAFPGIAPDQALLQAIQPGISRSVHEEGRGKWENTGFGLYVLSELGRQGGSFGLWSGPHRLEADSAQSTSCIPAEHLAGTAVQLRVSVVDAECFPNVLHDIVGRGAATAVPGAVAKEGPSKSRRAGWN